MTERDKRIRGAAMLFHLRAAAADAKAIDHHLVAGVLHTMLGSLMDGSFEDLARLVERHNAERLELHERRN
jgi:hypothetical protein